MSTRILLPETQKAGQDAGEEGGALSLGPVGAAQPLQGLASTGLLSGPDCSTQVLALPVGSTATQVPPSRGWRGKSVTVQVSLTGKAFGCHKGQSGRVTPILLVPLRLHVAFRDSSPPTSQAVILISTQCHLHIHSGPARTSLCLRGPAEMSLITRSTQHCPILPWEFSSLLSFRSFHLHSFRILSTL